MEKQLPAEILNKPKQGFSIPLKQWLQHSLRPMMLDLLSTDSLRRGNYFDPPTVNRWVNEHLAGQKNHSHRLWGLMVFELWQRKLADFNRYNYQQN
jgi:asparagine synthase (glutamine-hydrolysing)